MPGGVEFSGFLEHLYRVNLWSRTASRVLVRLGEFDAKTFAELSRKAAALPWEKFLSAQAAVTVRATCHKSKLYHSDAVAERILTAIQERLGGDVQNEGAQSIVVRLDHDHCTLSLDSSGDHLHQRSYRLAAAKAPLRETLAAALLRRARYDPTQPLLDPFCGSGTFAIEAALMARNIAPGLQRRFAFMNWVTYDAEDWAALMAEAQATRLPHSPAPILASDRDAGAIEAANANAERAGVRESIEFTCQSVSAIQPPPGPGLVIANLPYGKRVGEAEPVENLYAQFGKVLAQKCPGWRVAFVAGNLMQAHQTRLPLEDDSLWFENGGLKVVFVQSAEPAAK